MDRDTTLCLACSSSLPPVKSPSSSSFSPTAIRNDTDIFTTPCCSRPICPACLSSNPRLARYDPCLRCLGGLAIVAGKKSHSQREESLPLVNVDGAFRDEDAFVVGDDDEGENEGDVSSLSPIPSNEPMSNELPPSNRREDTNPAAEVHAPHSYGDEVSNDLRYHIHPNDTLRGIALRFGVDGHELCRLNKLPPSTLSTTPHILHTRTVITLPPSAQPKLGALPQNSHNGADVRRAHERAEKRLQILTKEVDWRVAKAYVALADDDADDTMEYEHKLKESGLPRMDLPPTETLEMKAVRHYYDDQDWEDNERREGRRVDIPRFPCKI